jgi:hypothetical protein
MIERVLEDQLIPDIIIQILRKNDFMEDVGLYSAENQSLYETRNSIMEKVIREMIRETINSAINSMINNYMRNRMLKNDKEDDEPLSVKSLDPLNRAARQIMDDFIRS